jgi:hypothetical protein
MIIMPAIEKNTESLRGKGGLSSKKGAQRGYGMSG